MGDRRARITEAGVLPRMSPQEELELLAAHRRGDPDALAHLLRAYQGRLYAICYRMVRDGHEARDLTQEAIVKVLEGLESFDGRSRLSTWIIRVTINCCLSHLRRQKLRRHASLDGEGDVAHVGGGAGMGGDAVRGGAGSGAGAGAGGELSPAHHVEQGEVNSIVLGALATLEPEMQVILVLRDMQGLEYNQIGDVLGIPIGTVKSRLFRARSALRAAAEAALSLSAP